MRKVLVVFILAVLLSFTSCVNTEAYISEPYISGSIDENLKATGAEMVKVGYPEVFYDPSAWLEVMTEKAKEAEDYIFIMSYLGSSAPRLEPFFDVLVEKARSGVDVYFMVDGTSVFDMTESRFYLTPLNFLKESGVHLHIFSPVSVTRLIAIQDLIVRDHRKLFVFDGEAVAVGGMNVNYISMGAGEENQRDSIYLFDSKNLATKMRDEFISIWNSASVDKIDKTKYEDKKDEEALPYPCYIFNQGSGGDEHIATMYSSLINGAQDEILFFGFVPILSDEMYQSLKNAKERGVKITMIGASEPRNASGSSYKMEELYDSVNTLYFAYASEDGYPLLHEKLMVVDKRYTVIGSPNFNYRSMGLGNEIALVIDSEELALSSRTHFFERTEEGALLVKDKEMAAELSKRGNWLSYMLVKFGG